MKRAGAFLVPEAETHQIAALSAGGWQVERLQAALRQVGRFRLAVDGGAHVGSWTAALAARFAVVHAFEPAADAFACLAANTGGLANVVRHPLGLGAEAGRMRLCVDDRWGAGNTGGRFLQPGDDIAVVTLDSFALPALDFLKLDLEGMEPLALAGAELTLLRHRPVVLLEDKPRFAPRYGLRPHEAALRLRQLGAREIDRLGADHLFAWD